ncbi:MAG: gas vesicle protein [Chloroflexi bacterium]|nr:gas vesicle protein [Chloroflexota bacterium]
MRLQELLDHAKSELSEMTGLKPAAVTRAIRDEEGWHVSLELLELARTPASTDVLGEYEVLLDDKGAIVWFQRKRNRLRGQAESVLDTA